MNIFVPSDPAEKTREFKPADGKEFTLQELQDAVGGNIEFVAAPDDRQNYLIIVNEEGLIHRQEYNVQGSFLAGQPLVGNVLIVEKKYVR